MKRRDFLGAMAAASIPDMIIAALHGGSEQAAESAKAVIDWSGGVPPLFCVAYIDPGIDSQKQQEGRVARYPMAIVPQDDREHFVAWRDKVREINPDIKLFGYQMVIEETTVPGPGHEVLRRADRAWIKFPGGYAPVVTQKLCDGRTRDYRIFDPRVKQWQDLFIESCLTTLESYSYQGLFLDQCTIFNKAAPVSSMKEEMIDALNVTLSNLRKEVGNKILIGNSSLSWTALNGEMNESRPEDMYDEFNENVQHYKPRVEMYMNRISSEKARMTISSMFERAIKYKAYFGVSENYQTVKWYDEFDKVLDRYSLV